MFQATLLSVRFLPIFSESLLMISACFNALFIDLIDRYSVTDPLGTGVSPK